MECDLTKHWAQPRFEMSGHESSVMVWYGGLFVRICTKHIKLMDPLASIPLRHWPTELFWALACASFLPSDFQAWKGKYHAQHSHDRGWGIKKWKGVELIFRCGFPPLSNIAHFVLRAALLASPHGFCPSSTHHNGWHSRYHHGESCYLPASSSSTH